MANGHTAITATNIEVAGEAVLAEPLKHHKGRKKDGLVLVIL